MGINRPDQSEIFYEPDQGRFRMPTSSGDAQVTFRWNGDVMELPHAEVPAALRGTGAGARLAQGVFEKIEAMGIKARLLCPFLLRVAKADARWSRFFWL
jgi:predicted GNAT family acetyltransferase